MLGAGGHAKVVVSLAQALGRSIEGLYDDDPRTHGESVLGVPVVGPISGLSLSPDTEVAIGVGDNRSRELLATSMDFSWVSMIHPTAFVHDSVQVDQGAVVFAGAVIQPGCRIGAHAIVNSGANVDHDCELGPYAQISPGCSLAGGVRVGEGAMLGTGCVCIPLVEIGEWAVVGAGAVCVGSVAARTLVVGVPAQVVRHTDEAQ